MEQMISKDSKSRLSAAEFMKKYRGKLKKTFSTEHNFGLLMLTIGDLHDVIVFSIVRSDISRAVLYFSQELHEQVCHASCSYSR